MLKACFTLDASCVVVPFCRTETQTARTRPQHGFALLSQHHLTGTTTSQARTVIHGLSTNCAKAGADPKNLSPQTNTHAHIICATRAKSFNFHVGIVVGKAPALPICPRPCANSPFRRAMPNFQNHSLCPHRSVPELKLRSVKTEAHFTPDASLSLFWFLHWSTWGPRRLETGPRQTKHSTHLDRNSRMLDLLARLLQSFVASSDENVR